MGGVKNWTNTPKNKAIRGVGILFQARILKAYLAQSIQVCVLSGVTQNHIICSHFYFSLWIEKTYFSRKSIPVYILSGAGQNHIVCGLRGALTVSTLPRSTAQSMPF